MSNSTRQYRDGVVLESAFFDNGNQKNTKYYLNNKESSTHPEVVPIFLGSIGLSTVIFVITGEGLFTWLFFLFIFTSYSSIGNEQQDVTLASFK
jgi:hypothetical protein